MMWSPSPMLPPRFPRRFGRPWRAPSANGTAGPDDGIHRLLLDTHLYVGWGGNTGRRVSGSGKAATIRVARHGGQGFSRASPIPLHQVGASRGRVSAWRTLACRAE